MCASRSHPLRMTQGSGEWRVRACGHRAPPRAGAPPGRWPQSFKSSLAHISHFPLSLHRLVTPPPPPPPSRPPSRRAWACCAAPRRATPRHAMLDPDVHIVQLREPVSSARRRPWRGRRVWGLGRRGRARREAVEQRARGARLLRGEGEEEVCRERPPVGEGRGRVAQLVEGRVRAPAQARRPQRPSPPTNRTRRVPHPVLIGHAASLTPY
jgi:hypothetical protein